MPLNYVEIVKSALRWLLIAILIGEVIYCFLKQKII